MSPRATVRGVWLTKGKIYYETKFDLHTGNKLENH